MRFPIYACNKIDYAACQPDVKIEAFRENVSERNLRILEKSERGESHGSLAQRFQLSRSRIDAIVHKFEEEKRRADRGHRLLEDIRQANDLDRPWLATELIDAIVPLPVTRNYLKQHFTEQRIAHLSLRTLIEMAIPEADGSVPGTPCLLLKVTGVGKKGFWSVVNRLTSLDLGARFKQEWEQRLIRLRRDWKISGKFPYA